MTTTMMMMVMTEEKKSKETSKIATFIRNECFDDVFWGKKSRWAQLGGKYGEGDCLRLIKVIWG